MSTVTSNAPTKEQLEQARNGAEKTATVPSIGDVLADVVVSAQGSVVGELMAKNRDTAAVVKAGVEQFLKDHPVIDAVARTALASITLPGTIIEKGAKFLSGSAPSSAAEKGAASVVDHAPEAPKVGIQEHLILPMSYKKLTSNMDIMRGEAIRKLNPKLVKDMMKDPDLDAKVKALLGESAKKTLTKY